MIFNFYISNLLPLFYIFYVRGNDMRLAKLFLTDHTNHVLICLIGAFISAIAVNSFILESNLGDGGTVCIALALKYAFGFSPAISSLIINTLVIIIGWRFLSTRTAVYTFI